MEAQVLKALEALKRASKEIESNPKLGAQDGGTNSPSMKALLALETGSSDLFSNDPDLSTLSELLSHLKDLAFSLKSKSINGISGFLRRRSSGLEIKRLASSIGSELQSWIDRESADRLVSVLGSTTANDEEKAGLLAALEERVAQGFDRALQDALLRAGVWAAVESVLADPGAAKPVRERAASAALTLMHFNKAVFVAMASTSALRALCGLVVSIRSPLIDELHANGELPKIISLLTTVDIEIRVLALDCVLEIGYYGRKEAIEEMLEKGLIKRLVALQRSDLGGALIEMDGTDRREVRTDAVERAEKRGCKVERYLETHPFASCLARFAIQLEVGEGLRQREKRAFKLEILHRVREAVISDAEAGTLLAEVLWGSTPW